MELNIDKGLKLDAVFLHPDLYNVAIFAILMNE